MVQISPLIYVQRGVLQGDPCSPLIFNIYVNMLMVTISANKYIQYGYLLGPNHSFDPSSCLQFAYDSLFTSNSIARAQALLHVIIQPGVNGLILLCAWTKCSTFGIIKRSGQYTQFQPGLFIADIPVPFINNGGTHLYILGRGLI